MTTLRFAAFSLALCLLPTAAIGQDTKEPKKAEEPKKPAKLTPAKPDGKTPKKAAEPKAKPIAVEGDLGKAAALFPLSAEKALRYQLKVWTISEPEEGEKEPVEAESPRRNTIVVKLNAEESIDGTAHKVLAYFLNGELQQQEFYRVEDGAIVVARRVFGAKKHALSFDLISEDGPQILLKKTMKKGDNWTWKGRIGRSDNTCIVHVHGAELIKVKGKEYKALKVKSVVTSSDDSKATAERWYSPGIGLVRELTEIKTATETIRTETLLDRIDPVKKE